jgi:hypothetical protein
LDHHHDGFIPNGRVWVSLQLEVGLASRQVLGTSHISA